MKNRFILILLLNLSCNFINAQNDFKRSLKLNLSSLPKTTFLRSTLDTNVFELTKIGYKVAFNPSFSLQTKRKNYWEFQFIGGKSNRQIYIMLPLEINDSLRYLMGSLNKLFLFNIKGINHIDLLKNKNSKFRFLLSFNYLIGYQKSMNTPYTNLSYNQRYRGLVSEIGISTRMGLNVTDRIYLEVNPPLHFFINVNVGKHLMDNPNLPLLLREGRVFDINYTSVLPFKYFRLENVNFNDLFSVGFKF